LRELEKGLRATNQKNSKIQELLGQIPFIAMRIKNGAHTGAFNKFKSQIEALEKRIIFKLFTIMPQKKQQSKKKKKIPVKKQKTSVKKKSAKKANKIIKYLEKAKVKFKLIEHKIVYTAHDTAKTTKKKLNEIAKVVLVKADKEFVLIILPAGKYVNLTGIKKALKAKKVSFAKEKDITKYLKTKVGLLHPFGSLYKIQTLIDKNLCKAKKMIASAGSYTESVEIALKDFEKLASPTKGVFSKSKK